MRRAVTLETCLALLLALFSAPFQHVHPHGLVHSHFYPVAPSHAGPTGSPGLDVDDDHAEALALDTFTLVLTTGLAPFIPSLGPVLLFVPSESFQPVEVVEECGHDPPSFDRSIPRAPPV
jgi:hypothetical protein